LKNPTFASILAKAKTEKKLVFMDAYASWCGPCKLMEKNVFTDKNVADFYNKNFINVRIDMEKGEGKELAMKYGVRSYPTFLFLNAEGEIAGKEYIKSEEFLNWERKTTIRSWSIPTERRIPERKIRPGRLLNFISLYASKDPVLAKQASEKYFQIKKR
jgi:thiol-disulfide isomerase/thioredoxin